MSTISTYKTVKRRAEGLYKEKSSKFIAYAIACYSENEAKKYIEQWRKEHFQARHLCWAYRFGLDKLHYRVNDDGEPTNSAGAPILGQIQSFDLSNILVGVLRYYGGVKLGVGGLIQAYKEAAQDALKHATIVELEVFYHIQLQFNYNQMPFVMNWLKKKNLNYSNQDFELDCKLDVKLPLNQQQELIQEIESMNAVSYNELGIY